MTTPVLSLSSLLPAVAALHGLVLGGVLLRSARPPRGARLCLAALVLTMSALLGNTALVLSGVSLGGVAHALLGTLWFAIGPLFYGYVRGLLPGRGGWEPEDIVHALPFVLQVGLIAAVLATPVLAPEAVAAGRPAFGFMFTFFYGLQSVAYAVVVVHLVGRYAARYRREAAGADDDRLVGLRRTTAVFGASAAAIAVNVGVLLATGRLLAWLDYLVPLALAVFVSAIGYGMLRRPARVLPALALPEAAPAPETPRATPAPETTLHADALRVLMEAERPYLDPEVRLGTLAHRLGVSERTLSQVLAEAMGGTFYDVVNGYRVAEAQARLADPAHSHLTVLAVGLDAGFSSKASFNRVFKKVAGETPSAYRARMAAEPPEAAISGDGALPEAVVSGDGAVREAKVA
ncbi:MAG: helix-turn-helix transcriptional regulator [Bacteroidota bacterium]